MSERQSAEQIVRALAAASQPTWQVGDDYDECTLCGAHGAGYYHDLHQPGCPWRQACEWVASPGTQEYEWQAVWMSTNN
jgi:hypothetical protein